MTELLPPAGQPHDYSAHSLREDLVAAATLVPQGLAYGAVAGLQPVTGLYTAVGAAALFSLVTSTRHIAVGPSATLAVLTFKAVRGPAGGDPGRAAMLAALLSIMAGALYLVAALVRLQGLADFFSSPLGQGTTSAANRPTAPVAWWAGTPAHQVPGSPAPRPVNPRPRADVRRA
ncbi:SulP family inorganic anion transporter [Nocardia sp. NBC_00565]|uniref:SulP family inorganic anion transporter n=1 Tax=Nocardia sp. NBC_00565 TaxID=2975993 RepID=UPI002E801E59|nr:SulP family inorganic anion transporter [Nocardia sp. NBC_00565]WUC06204.1 SulP family inorganic anion transporter [Nocardia sp. NBC_00565]